MTELTMTQYTFEIRSRVKVSVRGSDTEENQVKAEKEAILKAKKELDESDLDCIVATEYTDYEREFEEAI